MRAFFSLRLPMKFLGSVYMRKDGVGSRGSCCNHGLRLMIGEQTTRAYMKLLLMMALLGLGVSGLTGCQTTKQYSAILPMVQTRA